MRLFSTPVVSWVALVTVTVAVAGTGVGCGGTTAALGPTLYCPDGSRASTDPATGVAEPREVVAPPDQSSRLVGSIARGTIGPHGRLAERWRITLVEGERVRITMSGGFDTYLVLVPPTAAALENDDVAEGTLDSALDFVAPETGDYVLEASAYANDARGPYRLDIARGRAVPAPAAPRGARLAAGTPLAGALTDGDRAGADGKITDDFQFEGHRGDLVAIELSSGAFDTYLTLRTPDGQVIESDDISGANLNSRVQATLAADGAYAVEVSSYGVGARGAYSVRLELSPRPVRRVGGAGPVLDVTGASGHGRVFGVFVGIRDYGGESGDLPHCDEDATELARVLRERGVQNAAQQVVLTNAAATGAAVRAALGTLGAQMTDDDLLVFFYSGHGGQLAGTVSALEPDGLDETIHLRGGSVRDDELAAWIAPIRGTVLVALDSCYSGGFARDVVVAEHRVGIFASEEDTLSDVAARYDAGGFLSYWLRLGLAGAADGNRDATIRVGEIVDYLYGAFAEHRSEMATTSNGGAATYQHLVVARGSVVASDLLLRFPSDPSGTQP